MQAPFDLESALFSSGELSEISGLPRSIVDLWVNRGVLKPTRRVVGGNRFRGKVRRRPKGRPMFSIGPVFVARLSKVLGEHAGIGTSEWLPVGYELVRLAATAAEGNWMWMCARGIENGDLPSVYAFATRKQGRWLFDMHVSKDLHVPGFGADVPHIFVPMSAVFEKVYSRCKRLLDQGNGIGGEG